MSGAGERERVGDYTVTVGLSAEDGKKLLEFVRERWARACPMCEYAAFTAVGFSWTPISSRPGAGIVSDQPYIPTVLLSCLRCGFLFHLNAVTAGLLPPVEPK